MRNLAAESMSFTQELISWQLNSAEVLISLGKKQATTVMSYGSGAKNNGQWPEAMLTGLSNAVEMTRDSVAAVSDCQLEGLRLLPKQVDLARRFMEPWSALLPQRDLERSGEKKNNKTTSLYPREKAA